MTQNEQALDYRRPYDRAGITVTLRCNLNCANCLRYCNMDFISREEQLSGDLNMSQVIKFIEDVRKRSSRLKRITVTGGEPLLHPEIVQICCVLREELLNPGLVDILRLTTNGTIPVPGELTDFMFVETKIDPAEKAAIHRCTFLAPCDRGLVTGPCRALHRCGFNFSALGYVPCDGADGIVRLFDLQDHICTRMPERCMEFKADLREICAICPLGAGPEHVLFERDHGRPISKSYQEAIRRRREKMDDIPSGR